MTKRSLGAVDSQIFATSLRKGKWTDEEEKYATTIISHFESNLIPLCEERDQTIQTVRLYLSKQLHCDPMRISKKFAGSNSVGKRFFCKKKEQDEFKQTAEAIEEAKNIRDELRLLFIDSIEKEFVAASKRPKRIRIRNRKKTKPPTVLPCRVLGLSYLCSSPVTSTLSLPTNKTWRGQGDTSFPPPAPRSSILPSFAQRFSAVMK
jgi:hypothetical protein